jgi:hypothetical protein
LHPIFARRLQERLPQESNMSVVEASVLDIPLSADLIVMAEMLYYVPEPVMSVLSRLQARYLLTPNHRSFDACAQQGLEALGWRNSAGHRRPGEVQLAGQPGHAGRAAESHAA